MNLGTRLLSKRAAQAAWQGDEHLAVGTALWDRPRGPGGRRPGIVLCRALTKARQRETFHVHGLHGEWTDLRLGLAGEEPHPEDDPAN